MLFTRHNMKKDKLERAKIAAYKEVTEQRKEKIALLYQKLSVAKRNLDEQSLNLKGTLK